MSGCFVSSHRRIKVSKKIYVFDTSIILSDSGCFNQFGSSDIVLPLKVLEEIDGHKKRQDSVGANAREVIRFLDSLRSKGSLSKGVKIGKNKSTIRVEVSKKNTGDVLDIKIPDNEIVEVALDLKDRNPDKKIIVVSRDINMRVKCDAIGLECEEYTKEHVVDSSEQIYTGYAELVVDDEDINKVHNKEELLLEDHPELKPNQFLKLVSANDQHKTALVRYYKHNKSVVKINEYKDPIYGRVKPRSKEQTMALNLLFDHSIPVVTLVGRSGTGKTLLALAAALQMIEKEPERYRKVIVLKPIVAVGGKDVGFLPGSLQEKMRPWVAPIYDNLEFLLDTKKQKSQQHAKITVDQYFEHGIIEVEATTYIRGRSLANCIIIMDESQNLNAHEIKTIMTRVGEGTKIILTGDIEQVDSPYLDQTNNGLIYLVEKFKDLDLSGHMLFKKGERSKVADAAANLL